MFIILSVITLHHITIAYLLDWLTNDNEDLGEHNINIQTYNHVQLLFLHCAFET